MSPMSGRSTTPAGVALFALISIGIFAWVLAAGAAVIWGAAFGRSLWLPLLVWLTALAVPGLSVVLLIQRKPRAAVAWAALCTVVACYYLYYLGKIVLILAR